MGQGGYITLVNGTKYGWTKSYQHKYQMNSFPDKIPAGSSSTVEVEWNQGASHHEADDAGEATYTLDGTGGLNFQVQARAKNGFDLQVVLTGMETRHAPKGTTIDLGWNHDGYVTFVLAGKVDAFTVSGRPAGSWMQDNLGLLGDRTLRQLCIPGSHDAGMSVLASGTGFAQECNTLTQSAPIGTQLTYGSRYFDVRPVISAGKFLTGHYSDVTQINSWQGGNGQSIESIVQEVNAFTADNKELVILRLSHDLNTDVGNTSYRPFTRSEWNDLVNQLAGLNNLFFEPGNVPYDLSELRLSDLIGGHRAAVVVIVDPSTGITPGRGGQGFYTKRRFPVFDQYSNSNDVDAMAKDQLEKLDKQRPNPDSPLFLLSWTLTQNATQASTCVLGTARSIRDLANIANPQLYSRLLAGCSAQCYPNILYMDYVQVPDVTAMAMAVNWLSLS